TRPVPLGREERLEHALPEISGNARTVVRDADPGHSGREVEFRLDRDPRRLGVDTGVDRVPQQIADRLTEQHLVALHDAEFTADLDVATKSPHIRTNLGGGPLADRAEVH